MISECLTYVGVWLRIFARGCQLIYLFWRDPVSAQDYFAKNIRRFCLKLLTRCRANVQPTVVKEAVPSQAIWMSNHLSCIDMPLILACLPGKYCFIVKPALLRWPLVGKVLNDLGSIASDDPQLIERCRSLLAKGYSLWIFPEGTRSRNGQLGKIHPGPVSLAHLLGQPIVLAKIFGTERIHAPGSWCLRYHQPVGIDVISVIDDCSRTPAVVEHISEQLKPANDQSHSTVLC